MTFARNSAFIFISLWLFRFKSKKHIFNTMHFLGFFILLTCWTGNDFHHYSMYLLLPELKLLQELERNLFCLLNLRQGLCHCLVVLALVVDRVWQDQTQVQLRLQQIWCSWCFSVLKIINSVVITQNVGNSWNCRSLYAWSQ